MRRKEKVKGRSSIADVKVWESLRLKVMKNLDETGISAASNRDRSQMDCVLEGDEIR